MQLGVVFPQNEIGAEPIAVRDFVQTTEELGYAHLIVFDHILGVDTSHYPGWQGPYNYRDMFHEPLVLFGYLARHKDKVQDTPRVCHALTALRTHQGRWLDPLENTILCQPLEGIVTVTNLLCLRVYVTIILGLVLAVSMYLSYAL